MGRTELHPFPLALDDEARCHRLHSAGGKSLRDLSPQHRRDFVTIDAVQNTARFLRINQRVVDGPDVLEAAFHGFLGDFGESHAVNWHLRLEHLEQVPRDGFALAIGIGCEIQGVTVFEEPFELGDLFLFIRVHDVVGLEAVVDIHRELADRGLLQFRRQLGGLRKIANVPHGGLDDVRISQVTADGFDLGGRLHNEETLTRRLALGLCWHVAP